MKQHLKEIAILALCGINLGTIIGLTVKQNNYYPTDGIVTSVEADTVVVQDFNGNKWEFIGADDWQVGDICAMIMDSKGTDKIFDDEIVKTKYAGFTNYGE